MLGSMHMMGLAAAAAVMAVVEAMGKPEAWNSWSLSGFAAALVVYLLLRGERLEKQAREDRAEHLKAMHEMTSAVKELGSKLEKGTK